MAIKQGWTGRVFEDFEVGDIYPHPLGRTVIAADNICLRMTHSKLRKRAYVYNGPVLREESTATHDVTPRARGAD